MLAEECVRKLECVEGGEVGGAEGAAEEACAPGREEVAMTRKVVRSKRTTSVALQASASLVRWRVRTEAFGMRVWTMRDQACGIRGRGRSLVEGSAVDGRAHLVKTLVVDTRPKHLDLHLAADLPKLRGLALEHRLLRRADQVHLVDQQEDGRVGTVLPERVQALGVVLQVARVAPAFDLEDVDEHADVLEDDRLLRGEVGVHEGVLPAAVPEVEDEVPEEADVVLFNIDRCAEACGQGGRVIRARFMVMLDRSPLL